MKKAANKLCGAGYGTGYRAREAKPHGARSGAGSRADRGLEAQGLVGQGAAGLALAVGTASATPDSPPRRGDRRRRGTSDKNVKRSRTCAGSDVAATPDGRPTPQFQRRPSVIGIGIVPCQPSTQRHRTEGMASNVI